MHVNTLLLTSKASTQEYARFVHAVLCENKHEKALHQKKCLPLRYDFCGLLPVILEKKKSAKEICYRIQCRNHV